MDEGFERGPYRVPFRPGEQAFRSGVEQADSPAVVNDDDGIRRRLDDSRESPLVQKRRLFQRVTAAGVHVEQNASG